MNVITAHFFGQFSVNLNPHPSLKPFKAEQRGLSCHVCYLAHIFMWPSHTLPSKQSTPVLLLLFVVATLPHRYTHPTDLVLPAPGAKHIRLTQSSSSRHALTHIGPGGEGEKSELSLLYIPVVRTC